MSKATNLLEQFAQLSIKNKKKPARTSTKRSLGGTGKPRGIDSVAEFTERTRASARQNIMPRPEPTEIYLERAGQASEAGDKTRPLLVILDLNGTLLYRTRIGGNNDYILRPGVTEFLRYIFDNHKVMIWSSARPRNVSMMRDRMLSAEYKKKLVATWDRDYLRLSDEAYHAKSQVYKQLSWVWENAYIQSTYPGEGAWCQDNTVLIDDSCEKAASEPHNLIELEEFEGKLEQLEKIDLLQQVELYLEHLRSRKDVTTHIKQSPFQYYKI